MLPVAFCVRRDFDGVVSIISVAGSLDIATGSQLQSELDLVFNDGAQHVLIDLTETDFVETTGLRILLKASRQARGTASLSMRQAHDAHGLSCLPCQSSALFGYAGKLEDARRARRSIDLLCPDSGVRRVIGGRYIRRTGRSPA